MLVNLHVVFILPSYTLTTLVERQYKIARKA